MFHLKLLGRRSQYRLIEDMISLDIDINANTINARVSEEELAKRRESWKPRLNEVTGYLARWPESLFQAALRGAVLTVDESGGGRMAKISGSKIIAECGLLEQGVDTVFGYPGGNIKPR